MICPNRDGTVGYGGCIFCSAGGSGDFAESRREDISQQLTCARARIQAKTDATKFISYFQSYTNTYAPVEYLEHLFLEAVSQPEIVALSIGTRPDCLGDDVVALLSRLNQVKPVWVELGLQTIHERTAEYIRRGYPLSVYDDAVIRLKREGINVITHVILGLPGESTDDMLATVDYLSGENRPNGIKLQLLHVLRGTDLATEYEQGVFETMDQEAYLNLVCDCLERLPPDMVIHRVTGDGAKKDLLAPLWSADKKRVINRFRQILEFRDIRQGKEWKFG